MSERRFLEPTSDECNRCARVIAFTASDGTKHYGYACWYPQMGGYMGKAVVMFDEPQTENNDCFEVHVWHDGEFPFGQDTEGNPRHIHHCSADQFRKFAENVEAMQAKHVRR